MAEKKRTSSASSRSSGSQTKKAPTAAERAAMMAEQDTELLPVRYLAALVCLAGFITLLIIAFVTDGVVPKAIDSFVRGLVGAVCFYVSIPILLYMAFILAFSKGRPVRLRCTCLILFGLLCGAVSQIALLGGQKEFHWLGFGELWSGGIDGTTAGVLCGNLGLLVRWMLGGIFSYVVLIPVMIVLLMGAVGITLPKLVAAIRNRPRLEPEEEEELPPQRDPATVAVNYLAQRSIDRTVRKREQARQKAQQQVQKPEPEKKKKKSVDLDFLRQISADVDTPLSGGPQIEPVEDTPLEEVPVEEYTPLLPQPEPEQKTPAVTEPEPVKSAVPEPKPVSDVLETQPVPEPVSPPVQEQPPEKPSVSEVKIPPFAVPPVSNSKKASQKEMESSAQEVAQEVAQHASEERVQYCFPPIDLLTRPVQTATDGTAEMRENSQRLNDTLESFKIDAHIVNVTRGPSVTRYEVELEKGVRLSKLTGCADDIALSLGAPGVRIAAVPGKISVVGIEVPNRIVTTVTLREVVDSVEFRRAKSKSTFAVGKDISGSCIVGNISKLPHMLIAGTTGSGKSVCMNSIIISLIYKAAPEDVKLIMVDPKMVELGIYNGIPHLLIPVVTDPKKAAGALQWAVTEMMRRYRAMSDMGVRDVVSYNSIVDSQEAEGEHLPQIVVIIDELADLMLVAAKEVEEAVQRIAQMGRASGIHLIIATQRPSADVITGVMKANIPSRIAFSVASAMESRIILDTHGAEKLVGKGDMLFSPIGSGKPMRVQGCFVTDQEVEAVTTYVKEHYTSTYDQQVMADIDKKAEQTGTKNSGSTGDFGGDTEDDGDEMLPAAVDVLLETGQASVSLLQRRLKLGYARAARIVDEMEERGIVGPFQGSKPRAILITKEQWEAMKAGSGEQLSFDTPPSDVDEAPF